MTQPQPPAPAPVPPLDASWGPVVITSREIYDGLVRVSAQLSTIQQQLAQHTTEHQRRDEDIDARFQDHEDRLRAVERARWPLPSLAVLAAIAAVVIAWLRP